MEAVEGCRVGGCGPCVVLLPGLGCDHRLWQPVGDRLARRFRVVYPETWGQDSLAVAAHRVVRVLDRLGIQVAGVCGLSMGGYVAFELLRHHPERVRAVVLADTTSAGDDEARQAKRRQVLDLIRQGRFDAVLDAYASSVLGPAAADRVRETLLEMGRAVGPDAFAADVAAILRRQPYGEELRRLRVPALFLAGEHDGLTPPALLGRMADEVPGSHRAVIPGSGHMTPLENPDAVADVLGRFFAQVLLPG